MKTTYPTTLAQRVMRIPRPGERIPPHQAFIAWWHNRDR